jgi:hypothetical protein
MVRRTLTVALACIMLALVSAKPALAGTSVERETAKRAKVTEKVKRGVAKLGVGESARVEVSLRDDARVVGYVSKAGEDGFAVTNAATGATTQVPYADVSRVYGNNLSTGAKIAIGVGIGVGVTLLLIAILLSTTN